MAVLLVLFLVAVAVTRDIGNGTKKMTKKKTKNPSAEHVGAASSRSPWGLVARLPSFLARGLCVRRFGGEDHVPQPRVQRIGGDHVAAFVRV